MNWRYLACIIFLLSLTCRVTAATLDNSIMWEKGQDENFELTEKLERHSTIFNWTKGKIITELSLPVEHTDPNLGRQTSTQHSQIKKELKQNLINSLGALRISDLFQLKDYYNLKSDIRYEIIARTDQAFYYPPVEKKGMLYGKMELNIFGKDGIANLFYRSVDRQKLTKYSEENGPRVQEDFDTLILDTVSFPDFQPSINLRIFDQDGTLIYGPEIVEQTALFSKGICEYTTSLRYAFESPRCGEKVFYLIPFNIKGKMKTDLILHNEDAARLLANPKSMDILRQAKVIVVKPQPGR